MGIWFSSIKCNLFTKCIGWHLTMTLFLIYTTFKSFKYDDVSGYSSEATFVQEVLLLNLNREIE